MSERFRVGLFTSSWDQVAWQLVESVFKNVAGGFIPNAEVAFVFCTREQGETQYGDLMIRNVRDASIPLIMFPSIRFKPELREINPEAWRLKHDSAVIKLLPPSELDVLLGYMWIAGEEMCKSRSMINLHPALPSGPKGTYKEVIRHLITEQAEETGVMMHLVTRDLDEGPAIASCRFPITGGKFDPLWALGDQEALFDLIRTEGVKREFPTVIWTIKVMAQGKVTVKGGQVLDSQGQVLESGYDLTTEIEAALALDVQF